MKYSSRKFRRLEKKTGIFDILKKEREEIKEGEKNSFKTYWKVKKNASQLRDHFMECKAADLAKEKNVEMSSIIKQQKENEKSRRNNRKIKYTLQKLNKTSVTTVEIDDVDGSMKDLTSRSAIESACLQENYNKYSQTKDTICMKEPLRSLLGRTGNTSFCESILKRTATFPPNTPAYTQEFFQQMKRSDNAFTQPVSMSSTKEVLLKVGK